MQNDARRQELIKAKMQELKELAEEPIIESDPRDLYEEDEPFVEQEPPSQPQEKVYDLDQVVVLMWCETVNSILQEVPMSEYKAIRLASVRNKLLYEMDLSEFIPRPQQQPQEPAEPEQTAVIQKPHVPDIIDLGDDPAEPKFNNNESSLDLISQKLRDIESKKETAQQPVVQPQQVEAEQSGIQKLIGNITGANKKKVDSKDVIDYTSKPMSMG